MAVSLMNVATGGVAGVLKAIRGASVSRAPKKVTRPLVEDAPPVPTKPEGIMAPDDLTNLASGKQVDIDAEASRISGLNFKDFDVDQPFQINFDRITTTDEIKATIADVAERGSQPIQKARRGKITNVALQQLADDLDIKEDVVRAVMTRESGGTLSAETVLASRQVLNSSAKRLNDLAQKITTGAATDADKLSFRRQMQFHAEYQAQFTGARAEAGRALQAFAIPTGTDEGQARRIAELVETMHGSDIGKLADAVTKTDTIQGINKLTREHTRSKKLGIVQEVFINSILSGIKTHVVNFSGNALFQAMNVAETAVAARIGRFLNTEEGVMIGEAQAQMYGMLSGWKDGLRLAGKALRTGETTDNVHKLELPIRKAISAENLELSGTFGRAVDALGTFIRFPTERVLTAGDELFKGTGYRAEIARSSYREAMRRRATENLDDAQTSQVIRDLMENPPDELRAKAEDFALYATFQNSIPIARDIQGIVGKRPILRYLMPFIRTPTNLFKAGLIDRTPLGLLTRDMRDKIRGGGPDRDLALARLSMGTMTIGTVWAAAESGMITGGGPENFAARKLWLAAGNQPYSFRVINPVTGQPTGWQSYERAEPLAFIIGATADVAEIAQFVNFDDDVTAEHDEEISRLTSALITGVSENTMSKTFLRGLSDFVEVLNSGSANTAERWANGLISAHVPYSGLRRDLTKIVDPVIRQQWSLVDKLKANSGIPSLVKDVPPSLDIFGGVRFTGSGSILGVLSPFPDKPVNRFATFKQELVRVMQETRRVPLTMPSRSIEGLKLDSSEYHDLIKLSRKDLELDLGNGKASFSEALQDMTSSDSYELATDDVKIDLIKRVQQTFDKMAKQQLYNNDSEFAERLDARRARSQIKKFGIDNVSPEVMDQIESTF